MTTTAETKFNKWLPIIIQTVSILIIIIGLAVANEHRITIVEERQKITTETLRDTVKTLRETQNIQIKTLAMIEDIQRRDISARRDRDARRSSGNNN